LDNENDIPTPSERIAIYWPEDDYGIEASKHGEALKSVRRKIEDIIKKTSSASAKNMSPADHAELDDTFRMLGETYRKAGLADDEVAERLILCKVSIQRARDRAIEEDRHEFGTTQMRDRIRNLNINSTPSRN